MRAVPHAYLTTSSYALSVTANGAGFTPSQSAVAMTIADGFTPEGDNYRQITATAAANSFGRIYTAALAGLATGDYTLTQEIDVVTASPVTVKVFIADRIAYLTLPQGNHVVNTPFHYLSGTSNQQCGLSFNNLFPGDTVTFCTFRIYSGRVEQVTPYTVAIGTGPPSGGGPWRSGDQVVNAAGAGVAGIAGWFCTATGSPGSWVSMPAVITNPYILATAQYAPATLAHYTSSVTTLAAMDAANLTVAFTAPVSGNVLVTLAANASSVSTAVNVFWGLLDHVTTTTIYGCLMNVMATTTSTYLTAKQRITGLTGGVTYQVDWALASGTASSAVSTYAKGVASTSATGASPASPAVMVVEAL